MGGRADAVERWLRVSGAELFVREVGSGMPALVLHGGPDFDHAYFLPGLDALAENLRLVYYDQRGRGRSAGGVSPGDVTLASELSDVDAVRRSVTAGPAVVIGHSWGGTLAVAYALHRPSAVSHLVLLDSAPTSHRDWLRVREHLSQLRTEQERRSMADIAASDAYRAGELDAVTDLYRLHFRPTVPPALLDELVSRMLAHYRPATVLLARSIEERLYDETSHRPDFDLTSRAAALDIPTLVLHGALDFLPVDIAAGIAAAMPRARLEVLPGVGHFTFLEQPETVRRLVADFVSLPLDAGKTRPDPSGGTRGHV